MIPYDLIDRFLYTNLNKNSTRFVNRCVLTNRKAKLNNIFKICKNI